MALDFSMPAEWMPHARTWMAWPCRRKAWDGLQGPARAKSAYAVVAKAIAHFEPVVMAARPEDADEARQATGCEVFKVALDDSWAAISAPLL